MFTQEKDGSVVLVVAVLGDVCDGERLEVSVAEAEEDGGDERRERRRPAALQKEREDEAPERKSTALNKGWV